jgi:hypothetical protein
MQTWHRILEDTASDCVRRARNLHKRRRRKYESGIAVEISDLQSINTVSNPLGRSILYGNSISKSFLADMNSKKKVGFRDVIPIPCLTDGFREYYDDNYICIKKQR